MTHQVATYCGKCGGLIEGSVNEIYPNYCTCVEAPLQGWQCPRCYQIHSPFKSSCDCPPNTITKSNLR